MLICFAFLSSVILLETDGIGAVSWILFPLLLPHLKEFLQDIWDALSSQQGVNDFTAAMASVIWKV